ncbi:hypothetical protein GN244_ATG12552 [Phytophthora infestans]|uniref:M96 mating-specific protein family n=1 Tax=Phytophthora infestans TaxID=4787 RepID=A0A833SQ27_PHYIN|nr:hypothetical protein GN244_ATG12552 [Phytophthora infestans]
MSHPRHPDDFSGQFDENGAWSLEPSVSIDYCALPPSMTDGDLCVKPPSNPKKKRVRRQKLELEHLRKLVVSLEEQMLTLQTTQPLSAEQNFKKTADNTPSIWKEIAERQLKERARVEEKNQNLRSSLKGQLKLARRLEGLLRKRPRDEETEILANSNRIKSWPTDDEIFADQMAHVQRANLEVDRIFGAPEFVDQSTSFYNLSVTSDSNSDTGVAFVKKASSLIPFDLRVTQKALWRALAEEGTTKDSYFLDKRLSTDDVVVSSYGLHFRAGALHANVVDPVEINGTKFRGIRCHETGWILLRSVTIDTPNTSEVDSVFTNVPSISMSSTKLQLFTKMTMELQDDIIGQDLQVGALTDVVVTLHDTLSEVCGKMITNVLVEEDWNFNGWWGM